MSEVKINYQPLPAQKLFHLSSARMKLFRGGVGSGKTKAGAIEALRRALLNAGKDGMIVAPFYNILYRVTLRAFLDICPPDLILEHNKAHRYIELKNRSRVYYGSADKPETLEGSNLSWLWGDELRYWRKESYLIALARLRVPCAHPGAFFTTTPDMGWLYEEFSNKERGDYYDEFFSSSEDNHHLPPEFCESLRQTYTKELYDAYVKGLWVRLSGSVFHLTEQQHVRERLFDPELKVDIAFDPGFRKSAVLFIQKHNICPSHQKTECIHVLDELMINDSPTTKVADLIQMKLNANRWKVGKIFADPAANSTQTADGMSDVKVLRDKGFQVSWTTDPVKRSILTGIRLIQTKLGDESLLFSPSLKSSERGIWTSLQNSEYETRGELPVKDGIYDHARDALRYYLVNNCKLPLTSWVGT